MTVIAMPRPRVARSKSGDDALAAKPFTVPHFKAWAKQLTLDNGKPWVVEDFQAEFIADVFSGIPECWLVVPEGNGKTTGIAGLALYYAEFKIDASIPVAASSRDQGRRLYDQGAGFVRRSSYAKKRFRSYFGYRAIEHCADLNFKPSCPEPHSRVEIFAADERTGDGAIPDLAVLDELHRHKNMGLARTWRGKLDKRNGQMVVISTRGEPGSEFEVAFEEFKINATNVTRRGGFVRYAGPGFVLHFWGVPDDANVEDLEVVKAANPFSGITVETLRNKRQSPTMTLAHWSRYVCNRPTRSVLAAITEAEWAKAQVETEIPAGEPVMLGIDTAWKHDTTAIVPLWAPRSDFRLLGPARILTPPRDGNSLDHHLIERACVEIAERNPVSVVVMDVSFGLEQLAEWLEQNLHTRVIRRAQTDAFAIVDYESFMEALRLGWLHHSGDKGLTRHVMNAVARMLPGGRSRFDRLLQGRESNQEQRVIDALVAAAMVNAEYAHPSQAVNKTQRWGAA